LCDHGQSVVPFGYNFIKDFIYIVHAWSQIGYLLKQASPPILGHVTSHVWQW
jgi:hypothetical protein